MRRHVNLKQVCRREDGCGVVIAERIEDNKPAAVQKVSPAPVIEVKWIDHWDDKKEDRDDKGKQDCPRP